MTVIAKQTLIMFWSLGLLSKNTQHGLLVLTKMMIKQNDHGKHYLDSEAAIHVIGNAGKMHNLFLYIGRSNIITGDDSPHLMTHGENAQISIALSSSYRTLSNVVFAIDIKKNIIFTLMYVKDLQTKTMFDKGECQGNIYMFKDCLLLPTYL